MISLQIYVLDGRVEWRLLKYRPSALMRTLGVYAWHRSGFVTLDDDFVSDRQAISIALREVAARLGER